MVARVIDDFSVPFSQCLSVSLPFSLSASHPSPRSLILSVVHLLSLRSSHSQSPTLSLPFSASAARSLILNLSLSMSRSDSLTLNLSRSATSVRPVRLTLNLSCSKSHVRRHPLSFIHLLTPLNHFFFQFSHQIFFSGGKLAPL